jgi:hypothetical protein
MAEFSINNPNGYLAGPLGSFRVYGLDGRLKAIGAGGGGGATWGTITGDILNQTDLINYIASQTGSGFVPETRTLTINGVTYDLTADRTWTIPAGGTVTDVTGTGTVSGLTLTGTGTTSVTLTLGGSLVLVASDITTALGYTPLSQTTADTLYYPLTANPSNYVTSSALTTILSNYLTTSAAASTYLTIANAATTYQPIFTTQNGLTYGGGLLQLGGTLTQGTTISGDNNRFSILDLDYYQSESNSYTHLESGKCVPPVFQTNSYSIDVFAIAGQTVFNLGTVTSGAWTCGDPLLTPKIGGTFFVGAADGNNTATILAYDINNCEITLDVPITWVGPILGSSADIDVILGTVDNAYLLLDRNGDHPKANGLPTASVILQDCDTGQEIGVKAVNDGGTKKLLLLTNDYSTKTAGDVATLVDPATGEIEFQTPTGGGGGIPHGIAAGTDTYTVTIAGVVAYAEGDAYIIRFTNGNTASCTLNINGIGAVPLYRNNDGLLIGGDIIDNGDMLCVYDASLPGFRVIGTAPNTLLGYVTNVDSVAITKGQVVYAFGGQGDRMTVKLANNVGDSTSAQTVGVVLSTSIATNQKGLIIIQGLLDGLSILPTATFADGDPLYLGATAGSITNVKPYAPNHLVSLGNVTTASNGAAGRWYVRIQNGYELDELHNVQAQSPSLKDTLWYDNTVSPAQWKTASVPSLSGTFTIGLTIDGSGGTITVGQKGYVQVPYACTINSWRIIANVAGSIVIDVWKTAAPTIPTVANTITGSALPTLSSQQTAASSTLTGWTTSLAANDILGFNVNSASTVSWVVLQIFVTKL